MPDSNLADNPPSILFHQEDTVFELPQPGRFIDWIHATIQNEGQELLLLNFIFCSDDYLHQINVHYLHHDTLTDVITFPYHERDEPIQGDIFISIERIRENARKFGVTELEELSRVMIHGVLHLCGYGDKAEEERVEGRAKEDA